MSNGCPNCAGLQKQVSRLQGYREAAKETFTQQITRISALKHGLKKQREAADKARARVRELRARVASLERTTP